MVLDETDEVGDVHDEEYGSQHRALRYPAQQTSGRKYGIAALETNYMLLDLL